MTAPGVNPSAPHLLFEERRQHFVPGRGTAVALWGALIPTAFLVELARRGSTWDALVYTLFFLLPFVILLLIGLVSGVPRRRPRQTHISVDTDTVEVEDVFRVRADQVVKVTLEPRSWLTFGFDVVRVWVPGSIDPWPIRTRQGNELLAAIERARDERRPRP